MSIKTLNENLSRYLYESGLTDQELIDKMKNLKGQYFAGSLKETSTALSIPAHFIAAVCRGDRNHTHGYHFKYVD